MLFAVICTDRPGAGELRERALPDHLRYLETQHEILDMGGPLRDPFSGALIGSLYFVDVADYAGAEAFIEGEPLSKAGLFESTIIRRFTTIQPESVPDRTELLAQELERQAEGSRL